jgi:hypothetical protein
MTLPAPPATSHCRPTCCCPGIPRSRRTRGRATRLARGRGTGRFVRFARCRPGTVDGDDVQVRHRRPQDQMGVGIAVGDPSSLANRGAGRQTEVRVSGAEASPRNTISDRFNDMSSSSRSSISWLGWCRRGRTRRAQTLGGLIERSRLRTFYKGPYRQRRWPPISVPT